jgi:hypothetical protein
MDFRYKVGELVELSAAGRRNQHNDKVYDMLGNGAGVCKAPDLWELG